MDQMKGTVSKGKRHTFQFICFLLQILLLENESPSEWAERTERNMKDM